MKLPQTFKVSQLSHICEPGKHSRVGGHSALSLFFLVLLMLSSHTAPLSISNKENVILFRIERSRDADEIWYSLNTNSKGVIDSDNPVNVFWVRKSDGNRIEPLTRIQEKFSYGIHSIVEIDSTRSDWQFRLAAYKQRVFVMRYLENESAYRVYTQTDEGEIEVQKLYVEFDGGSFLSPSIAFVRLTGINIQTGRVVNEIITGENDTI